MGRDREVLPCCLLAGGMTGIFLAQLVVIFRGLAAFDVPC